MGKDTLVLTSNSWFHEQKNFKHVGMTGVTGKQFPGELRSREIGHNSYIRIKGFDFSSGYTYWDKTKEYWADVRFVWKDLLKTMSRFTLKKEVQSRRLFQVHFSQASDDQVLNMSQNKRRELIKRTLLTFIK